MALRQKIQARWQRWLDRRIPRVAQLRLTQRSIFIFPTSEGFAFLVIALLLFIGGINYENSLMLGTAFLLGSLFLVTIVATFVNLAGLTLHGERATPVFAGELSFLDITLEGGGGSHFGIVLMLEGHQQQVNVESRTQQTVTLPFGTTRRGKGYPPRVLVESRFPLGFVRAWTWVAFDEFAVVYPAPQACALQESGEGTEGHNLVARKRQDEDFAGIRDYHAGDALKDIAWKQLARSGEMLTRYREGGNTTAFHLDFDSVPAANLEGKLAQLAWWVREFERQKQAFSLRIPGADIPRGEGSQHLHRCLAALALYGVRG